MLYPFEKNLGWEIDVFVKLVLSSHSMGYPVYSLKLGDVFIKAVKNYIYVTQRNA